jgi:hypothetical protein
LAAAGHDEVVDHRSLKQQGLHRQPEHHLGSARIRTMSQQDKNQYTAERAKRRASAVGSSGMSAVELIKAAMLSF